MSTRRKFLKSSILTSAIIPLAAQNYAQPQFQAKISNLEDLKGEEFWKQVRMMFPIPLDEAYFNTGTLGVLPYPVLNQT